MLSCEKARKSNCSEMQVWFEPLQRPQFRSLTAERFSQEFREVAKQYPMIKAEEMIVDNTCMQLAGRPDQFDVMARTRLP